VVEQGSDTCFYRTMIEARDLTKVFEDRRCGEIRAVDSVCFVAERGQVFGLLGANGAGKTTTLRMLATIIKPTSGHARVAGHDVVEAPDRVRQVIGFLSGSTALYGRLTACEMIEYFGRLYGLEKRELTERLDELIVELEMSEFANRRCDRLSTGQKQRVSIARSIVHRPTVMVFDEPTTGLDVMTARTITRFIRKCREEGRTVVLSTHIMSEAEALCDRIAVIHNGKIAATGTIDELRAATGQQTLESVFLAIVGEPEEPIGLR
jgi:sodium transport system ATP-binding protein